MRARRRSRRTKARGSTSTECLIDPTTPENLDREDGRGLFLMRKLMDRVDDASKWRAAVSSA